MNKIILFAITLFGMNTFASTGVDWDEILNDHRYVVEEPTILFQGKNYNYNVGVFSVCRDGEMLQGQVVDCVARDKFFVPGRGWVFSDYCQKWDTLTFTKPVTETKLTCTKKAWKKVRDYNSGSQTMYEEVCVKQENVTHTTPSEFNTEVSFYKQGRWTSIGSPKEPTKVFNKTYSLPECN